MRPAPTAPRLRDNVEFRAVEEGVLALGHEGLQFLPGKGLAAWLDRLTPHLDGQHTEAELTAKLGTERKLAVLRVIEMLRSRELLHDVQIPPADPGSAPSSDDVLERRYAGYFRDGAAGAVDHYRSRRVVIVGSGPLASALAGAARVSGIASVRILEDREGTTLEDAELAVHVLADGPVGPSSPELTAHVTVEEDEVWLGPVVGRDEMGDAAIAGRAWSLRRAALPADPWTTPPRPWPGPGPQDGLVLRVAANQLMHWVFGRLTGTAPANLLNEASPDPGRLARLRLVCVGVRTLDSQVHTAVPHPFSALDASPRGADDVVGWLAELDRLDPLDDETFSRRAAACVDERLGIIRLRERDLVQFPLHVCEVEASDPVGVRGGPSVAREAALDYEAARCRAARRGLAMYGSAMVDPRRLWDVDGARPLCRPDDDPVTWLARLRDGQVTGHVWGVDLADGRPRLLDAATVFPDLRPDHPGRESPPEVVAGNSWREAVRDAVVDLCRRRAVEEIGAAAGPYARLDIDALPLDATGARCLSLWRAIREPLEVYDLTGSSRVPVLAFCIHDDTVTYASGGTMSDAVTAGLEHVLLWYQARSHGQPDCSPPPVPPLRPELRSSSRVDPGPPGAGEVDPTAVARRLAEQGLRMTVVQLDHDPAVAAVLPYVARVVLTDA